MAVKAVICGSFHRDTEKLRRLYLELTLAQCQVLSPFSLDFTNNSDSFLKTTGEDWLSATEIERHHLTAIAHADFVWLHLPQGYIGTSTALEIGFALARGIPLFSHELPADEPFISFVQKYESVFAALVDKGLVPLALAE